MKLISFIFTLIFAVVIFSQVEVWEKKGVAGGVIVDLFKDTNLNLFYIATDSGIYKSSNLTDWFSMVEGLQDFSPLDTNWIPYDQSSSLYVLLTRDGVYAKKSSWANFKYANPTGLLLDGVNCNYSNAKKVAFYKEGSNFYVYLSLEGMGLFKRSFDPTVSENENPWGTSWQEDLDFKNLQGFNPHITSLSSLDGGNILIASAANLPTSSGNIFKKTSSGWEATGETGVNYTTLSKNPQQGNFKIFAGSSNSGIFYSSDGGSNFSSTCSVLSGYEWKALSFYSSGTDTYLLGGTSTELFLINPNDCQNGITNYSYFMGESSVTYLSEDLKAYVGTRGAGIWEFPATDAPGKPIGVKGNNRIIVNNVSDITFTKSLSDPDAPPVIFASSRTEGLYKCFNLNSCTRYFYAPSVGSVKTNRGVNVVAVPGYDEYGEIRYDQNGETKIGIKTLYLATQDFGIFRSDNGGASWKKLITFPLESPNNDYEIVKLLLAPDFNPTSEGTSDKHIYVLTRNGLIFKSIDGGENWSLEVDLNTLVSNARVIGEDMVISPGYLSDQDETQTLFVATSSGIFKRFWDGQQIIWQYLPNFSSHATRISLSPCFGLNDCPCPPPQEDPECQKEKTTILVGTKGNGLYYSPNGGTNFYRIEGPNCPTSTETITALSMHPKTDVPNTGNRLLHYVVSNTFETSGANTSKFLYIFQNSIPAWQCQNADSRGSMDYGINSISFHPSFGQNNVYKLLVGHTQFGIYKNDHPPSNPWVNFNDFYNVPPRINSIAECPSPMPENPNRVVIAGTENYGVMISFDSGETYWPWSYGFEYINNGKFYTIHNAEAVACTDIFDPCSPLGNCPRHRILASSSTCTNFDETGNCINKRYDGIFWSNFLNPFNQSRWNASLLNYGGSNLPMTNHFITELRYCSLGDSVYASDFGFGVLYSNFGEGEGEDGWGKIWHRDEAGDFPLDVADITCPGGQSGPSFGFYAAYPDLRPGRPGFIWGAQSGVSQGLRAGNGKAKYKTGGVWYNCTGLSNTANWRSIIMLSSESVLIGDKGLDTNLSSGIFRNSQEGTNCDTWDEANMGFSVGDSPQITENYSKKAIAFAKVSNGVLVALEKGGLNNREGGVFFSDTDSDGLAWVPVNSGMNCTSNYEVYNGQNIYTGSTCSGVYSTDVIEYEGYPTAYFTYEKSSNPWYENRVYFYDRSAGLPTGRKWDFDNDSTIDAEPSSRTYTYDFPSFGYHSYNTKITSCQNTNCDNYELDDDGKDPIEIVNTFIPKLEKSGNNIKIYWNRVSGGGHTYTYNIWSSSNAEGTSPTNIKTIVDGTSGSDYDCTVDPCWYEFNEPSSTKYYKIKTSW